MSVKNRQKKKKKEKKTDKKRIELLFRGGLHCCDIITKLLIFLLLFYNLVKYQLCSSAVSSADKLQICDKTTLMRVYLPLKN